MLAGGTEPQAMSFTLKKLMGPLGGLLTSNHGGFASSQCGFLRAQVKMDTLVCGPSGESENFK